MIFGKIQVRDVVVFLLALSIFLAKYFHLINGADTIFASLLSFYIGHRTSGNNIS
jgi:hypothetical protein